ncbi:MAG: HD-GYP domain-containing protein [Thermodesulfovibrionales bacterium]
MSDNSKIDTQSYRVLSRLAAYTVFLAWFVLGIYVFALIEDTGVTLRIVKFFLSTEESGVKFRALILLAPLALTLISYLINERAKLFQQTLSAESELRSLLNGLVVAFANALDAKSHWTMGHSERVSSYAMAIAREMRVDKNDLEMLKIGSLLHDIGKLGTYDVILEKVDPLTEEEWKLIKMHPVKGAAILDHIEQLRKVIPMIRYHHERIDGKGYPDGLKGHDIPLLARILCVADSFDAMTADRPYKRALAKEDAIVHIKDKTGTQFDPGVVETFLKVIDSETAMMKSPGSGVATSAEAAGRPIDESQKEPISR